MQRGMFAALLLAGWLGVGSNFASAQFGTLGQPPFRPHSGIGSSNLNAFNYYNQIQSQLNPDGSLKSGLQQSQQQQQQTQQQSTTGLGGLQTGHAASFFNYGHYYPLSPPIGNASGAGMGFGPGFGGQSGLGNFGVGGLGTGGFGAGRFGLNNRSIMGSNLNAGFVIR